MGPMRDEYVSPGLYQLVIFPPVKGLTNVSLSKFSPSFVSCSNLPVP